MLGELKINSENPLHSVLAGTGKVESWFVCTIPALVGVIGNVKVVPASRPAKEKRPRQTVMTARCASKL